MNTEDFLNDVQLELGMMQDSVGWNAQRPVVLSKLRTSVELLDDEFRDRLRYVPNVVLDPAQGPGSYDEPESLTSYSVPDDCDPNYIDALSTQWSGIWYPLRRGITQEMRDDAYQATTTYLAWDVIECGEIEVWPHPTTMWPVRISYTRKPNSYQTEDGCIDMDYALLKLLTLDQCIPFYNRPDGDSVNRKLNRHLGNIKSKQLHNKRFFKGRDPYQGGTPDAADRIYTFPYEPGING